MFKVTLNEQSRVPHDITCFFIRSNLQNQIKLKVLKTLSQLYITHGSKETDKCGFYTRKPHKARDSVKSTAGKTLFQNLNIDLNLNLI